MADSYDYTFIEHGTRTHLVPDEYIGENPPQIGDVLTFYNGIKYRVVDVDEHSEFKDYDDHGSEYYYYITVIVERLDSVTIDGVQYAVTECNGEIHIDNLFISRGTRVLVLPATINDMPVVAIGNNNCKDCSGITEITFPDTIRNIGIRAFGNCRNLKKLTLPKSLKLFRPNSFENCECLEEVYIPAPTVLNVGYIGYYFEKCSNLTSITVDPENKLYDSREHCNAVIETATNKMLIACKGTALPDSVTEIAKEALKKAPFEVLRSYYSRKPVREWKASNFVLKSNEDTGMKDKFTYMDVKDGLVHLHGHEIWRYQGGEHLHYWRDYLDMDLGSLLAAWSIENGCDCSTWESFSEALKYEFNRAYTYYGRGLENLAYFLEKYDISYQKVFRKGKKLLLYFHGFGSSGEGGTVKTLTELLPDWVVIAPDIPVDPAEALPFLKKFSFIEPEVVVGMSMGGMYAQQMRGLKRICINPAFDLSKPRRRLFGKRKGRGDILKEGTFEFLNPRRDGEKTFTITPEIISHFAEVEAHQFDDITDEDRENVYGLFADNDTTVNCEDVFREHYKNVVHFHGEHRLNRQVIEEVLVPLIKEITKYNENQ